MKCPKCQSDEWRCEVYQSVDVKVGYDFEVLDNGFNFSDPEIKKDTLFCNSCGFEPKKEK